MKVRALTEYERKSGANLDQWLCGIIGALITTLPSFLFIPIWFLFSERYRICKDDATEVDGATCFFIGLGFGLAVWAAALTFNALG